MNTFGIVFAIIAMFAWGFGDYFIQKSTRTLGNWETLCIISGLGVLILLPFAFHTTIHLLISAPQTITILTLASVVLLFGALLEFEALKEGKLSVVEPIWSTEIISSVFLAFLVLKESLALGTLITIAFLIMGLCLISIQKWGMVRKMLFERAALIALVSAIVMGGANFMIGLSSRLSDPFVTNFYTSAVLFGISFVYLWWHGLLGSTWKSISSHPGGTLRMALLDNGAWIAFALAMTLAPIGIAVALSESYIIIAVLLGLFKNKEQLTFSQKIGLGIAVVSAIVLAGKGW